MTTEVNKRLVTVFLDVDGVIRRLVPIEGDPKNSARWPSEVLLIPGADKAHQLLYDNGLRVIWVTNQPNVAKNKSTWWQADGVKNQTLLLVIVHRVFDIFTCYHHPKAELEELRIDCDCRKPKPGLLLQAKEKYGLDLTDKCWFVGDSKTDMECSLNAGMIKSQLIFIGEQYDCEIIAFSSLLVAAEHIITKGG